MTRAEREREIAKLEKKMKEAAKMMEFEYAAVLRDEIIRLHNGTLAIGNAKGGGCIVTIRLPIVPHRAHHEKEKNR